MPNRLSVWLMVCLLALPKLLTGQPFWTPASTAAAYLVDSTGQLAVASAWKQSAAFVPLAQPRVSLGVGKPPVWLRLRVYNPASAPQPYVFTLENPFLDDVRFFLLSAQGALLNQSARLGWAVLPAFRPVNHRYPAFQFTVPARQTRWLLLRVDSPIQPMLFSFHLRSESDFWLHDRQERLFWNWILGIFCWYIVVGLIFSLLLKRAVYGYYSLYILGVCTYLMAIKGFWLEWFPAVSYGPVSGRMLPPFLTFSAMLAGLLFIRHYILSAVWNQPWIRRLYYLSIGPLVLTLVLICLERNLGFFYIQELRWTAPLISIMYVGPLILTTGLVMYLAWRERSTPAARPWQSPARWYLLGMLPLVIYTIARMLSNYAFITDTPLVHFEGVALAYLLEFILLSVGLGFGYRSVLYERHQLTQQTLQQQLQLQQEQNRALQSRLKLQQEKERIARDLHDNVGAQLSVIATSLDHIRLTEPLNGTGQQLGKIGDFARDAIGSLRETIWAINSEHLSLDAFRLQLQQYIARQQSLLSHCSFLLRADRTSYALYRLTSEQALNLFRISQEAIQNAVRHARAEQIIVSLTLKEPDQLLLTITDDGVGFTTPPECAGHYGLQNMKERAVRAGGVWSVDSTPGEGTRISVRLQIENT